MFQLFILDADLLSLLQWGRDELCMTAAGLTLACSTPQ